jgi:cytidyltransferase-like protein
MRIVITSGYYNPLHSGHLECMRLARELGDDLIVIVNNDAQVAIKGSRPFMNQDDRLAIVGALKPVSEAILSIDQDGSVCNTIRSIRARFPNADIIFAKGGDRFAANVPEVEVCASLGIKIVDGLGGKIRSSSELLAAVVL